MHYIVCRSILKRALGSWGSATEGKKEKEKACTRQLGLCCEWRLCARCSKIVVKLVVVDSSSKDSSKVCTKTVGVVSLAVGADCARDARR